ncbi:hypothetical protein [Salipiger sp. PrR007]|uniref:hypothetical protein n=1 Tax=Salipiger sp. PrR007 TaxID=2706884 RepID=UPI0013B989A7|nr:hypothetical protein [Salipiger sp. PrR007]NDW33021.1 hypothetical protein [Salipiger sp. PrR007]
MKKLFLHIGMQKTGTSSIQLMLHSSEEALRKQSFFYPRLPMAGQDGIWKTAFRQNLLAASLADYPSVFAKYDPGQIEVIRAEILSSPLVPIISAEDFSRQRDFGRLKELLKGFEVSVIVYLRRQDKFAESLYNQRNKILLSRMSEFLLDETLVTPEGLNRFLTQENYTRLLDYKSLVERLRNSLDLCDIHIREYERDLLVGGDVCLDFCSILGIDAAQMTLPKRDANGNVDNRYFAKLRDIYATSGKEPAMSFMQSLNDRIASGEDLSGKYALMTSEVRRAFLRQHTPNNTWIAEQFGVFSGGVG